MKTYLLSVNNKPFGDELAEDELFSVLSNFIKNTNDKIYIEIRRI